MYLVRIGQYMLQLPVKHFNVLQAQFSINNKICVNCCSVPSSVSIKQKVRGDRFNKFNSLKKNSDGPYNLRKV